MEIIEKSLGELKPYENNPRINDAAVPYVANSIRDFGFKVPIIIDKDGVIVAGHTRFKAAMSLRLEKVPCIIADDLTPKQIAAFRLADNKVGEIADWDMEALSAELEKISDFDMSDFGFDDMDISAEEEKPSKKPREDSFDIEAALKKPPITKPGDLWLLGKHRLMCGDATDKAALDRLLSGEEIYLYITDPPYNVSLGKSGSTAGSRKEYQQEDGGAIVNDNLPDRKFRRLLIHAFANAKRHMIPGAAFYIWYSDSESQNFRNACADVGWEIRQTLIWNKSSLVLGRQDYQWKHEPCLYGWNAGTHRWFGDRAQTTVKKQRTSHHEARCPFLVANRQQQPAWRNRLRFFWWERHNTCRLRGTWAKGKTHGA